MSVWRRHFVFLTIVGMLLSLPLWGQSTGSITGTVRDKSGAVIPGAQVQVVNAAQNTVRTTTTNTDGAYFMPGLDSGSYNVVVSAKGFQRTVVQGITLRAGAKVRADASMEVGSVSKEVTVSGSTIGQVQTQSSDVAGTVTGKEVTHLELNGRNFSQLITLVPGVSNQTGQDEGTVGIYGNVAYSVNGGRTEYNNWQLDGANIMDNGSNSTLNVYPSVDAIAHVRVLTSNYGAQYGRNASGTVQAETKSGTNQWHGDAYEFLRNDAMNARSFFDQSRPAYKKNDFGYTLGGPIRKDKTFFFWSEEWRKEKDPNTFNAQVPSTLNRQGNFSDLCPASLAGPTTLSTFRNSYPDCPVQSVDPTTQNVTLFPGNQVTIDPNGAAMLPLIPAPTTSAGGQSYFNSSPSTPTNWREELLRLDENFSSNEQFYFRFIHDSWNTTVMPTLWAWSNFPTVQTNFAGPGVDMVAHLTSTLSPTMVNEFVADYTTDHIALINQGPIQLPSSFTMKGIFNNGFGGKIPSIALMGNAAYGGGFAEDTGDEPWYNSNPTYEYRDQISQIVGTHNLNYGASLIAGQKNEMSGGETQGLLSFSATSPVSTGNALADMFLGRIASYNQTNIQGKYYNRFKMGGIFLQDDWRATSRLTLNLGLRLDLMGTYRERYMQAYNFEPAVWSASQVPTIDVNGNVTGQAGALVPNSGNPFNGIVQCGKNSPPGCMNGKLFNWSPRIGFAWDPFGKGTTAVRAAYGIFYDHTNGNEANTESLEGTPPQVLSPTSYNISGYNNVGGGTSLLFPLGLTAIPTQAVWPYVQQWHLDVEHQFFGDTSLTVSYVGSKGTHLTDQRNLNQLYPLTSAQNPYPAGQPMTQADCNTNTINGAPVPAVAMNNFSVACGNNPDPLRPYVGYGSITYLENGASSSYNSLQIAARRNVGAVDLSLAYTWSHSIDNSSDRYDGSFVNSYNLNANRASSNFDQRHILNAAFVYQLPLFAHSSMLGGWQVSGIFGFQTGTPFSVTNAVFGDNAGVANGSGTGSRPDVAGNPNATAPASMAGSAPGPLFYNPAAFVAPQGLTFGNAGRNLMRNPGRTNLDMGIFKTFKINERQSIEFRVEGFNVFNHTQWTGLNNSVSCYGGSNNSAGDPSCTANSNFLHPSGAHLGRILQLGLKYHF